MGTRQRGLQLLVKPERTEAVLWVRLRIDHQQDARTPLFERYVGFARSIARRLRPWGQRGDLGDAEHWAYEGLLKAIDNFDPLRGAPFPAYAKPRISGSVKDGFARSGELEAQWSFERRMKAERLRSLRAGAVSGADPDPIETLGEIATCLAIGLMLDDTRLIANDETADPEPSAYESLAWRQTHARLRQEIERLHPSEVIVIRQHYLNGLTFSQVAELMGLTRGRISQLHTAALGKLRKRISKED